MGQENVVLEAFQLGADDFIAKPFSPNELSMRVKRLMVR
jgi:DNA-binding response OmpR family regulator